MSDSPSPTSSILRATWDGLSVEHGFLEATGEFDFAMPKQAISVAFVPHDRVTWSVDGGKTQTTALPAGSVFLYGDREFVWHQRQRASEYVNLYLDPEWLQTLATEQGLGEAMEVQPRWMFSDPTILHVAQLLGTEVKQGGLAGPLYVEALRNLLGVHLLRHHTTLSKPAQPDLTVLSARQVQTIKDYIEANLAEALSIGTLAALIPMSQFHFARAFKAAIGLPPHRYLIQRRMEQAKVLLTVTQFSIAEIAYRVGFSNQSHFTAQFRKSLGMTPKQYRDRQ